MLMTFVLVVGKIETDRGQGKKNEGAKKKKAGLPASDDEENGWRKEEEGHGRDIEREPEAFAVMNEVTKISVHVYTPFKGIVSVNCSPTMGAGKKNCK